MSSLSAGPAQAASKIAATNERPELRVAVTRVTLVKLYFIDDCPPAQLLYLLVPAIEPITDEIFPGHCFAVLYVTLSEQ
jgi:hypothetical protein